MPEGKKYRIVNKEVIRLGKEATLDALFREWIYPDLEQVAPELMKTAHTFRPVGGGQGSVVYFTAEVDAEQVVEYGPFVWKSYLEARPEAEVKALYDEFNACVSSIHRLSLAEVMTAANPGIVLGR